MELIEGSETSAISNQTPGKHPKIAYIKLKCQQLLRYLLKNCGTMSLSSISSRTAGVVYFLPGVVEQNACFRNFSCQFVCRIRQEFVKLSPRLQYCLPGNLIVVKTLPRVGNNVPWDQNMSVVCNTSLFAELLIATCIAAPPDGCFVTSSTLFVECVRAFTALWRRVVSCPELFCHANIRVPKMALTNGRYVLSFFFLSCFRITLPAIAVLRSTIWGCLFIAHLHHFYISVFFLLFTLSFLNSLKVELNPNCHLMALLGAHHILHVSRIRVKESEVAHVIIRPLMFSSCIPFLNYRIFQ
jgi:hypothetical protein